MRISDWRSDVCSSDLNFSFIGASTLVLECHRPEERTRVQSVNDFIVFGAMAIGSFASGSLLTAYGWDVILWGSYLPLAVAIVALAITLSWPRAGLAGCREGPYPERLRRPPRIEVRFLLS